MLQFFPAVDDAEFRRPELQLLASGASTCCTSVVDGKHPRIIVADDLRSKSVVDWELPDVVQLLGPLSSVSVPRMEL